VCTEKRESVSAVFCVNESERAKQAGSWLSCECQARSERAACASLHKAKGPVDDKGTCGLSLCIDGEMREKEAY
jgi:hypothetical protein